MFMNIVSPFWLSVSLPFGFSHVYDECDASVGPGLCAHSIHTFSISRCDVGWRSFFGLAENVCCNYTRVILSKRCKHAPYNSHIIRIRRTIGSANATAQRTASKCPEQASMTKELVHYCAREIFKLACACVCVCAGVAVLFSRSFSSIARLSGYLSHTAMHPWCFL